MPRPHRPHTRQTLVCCVNKLTSHLFPTTKIRINHHSPLRHTNHADTPPYHHIMEMGLVSSAVSFNCGSLRTRGIDDRRAQIYDEDDAQVDLWKTAQT